MARQDYSNVATNGPFCDMTKIACRSRTCWGQLPTCALHILRPCFLFLPRALRTEGFCFCVSPVDNALGQKFHWYIWCHKMGYFERKPENPSLSLWRWILHLLLTFGRLQPKWVELDAGLRKAYRTSFLRDLFDNVRMNYFVLPVTSPKVWGDKRSGLTCTGRPEAALKILKDASFSLEGRVFYLVRLGDFQLTLAVSCFQLTGGTCRVFRLLTLSAWDKHAPAMCCGFI